MIYFILIIHFLGIFITLFGVFFFWQVLILQGIVIASWFLNKNKCILTQLEDKYLGTTLIEAFYQYSPKNRYLVPTCHRYMLYFSFSAGLFYHFY